MKSTDIFKKFIPTVRGKFVYVNNDGSFSFCYGYYQPIVGVDGKGVIITNTGLKYEVLSDTVGMLSELTDKNFVKIYDGDIISVVLSDGQKLLKIVKYLPNKGGFKMANVFELDESWDIWQTIDQKWLDEMNAVVEGNMYDNPELLK